MAKATKARGYELLPRGIATPVRLRTWVRISHITWTCTWINMDTFIKRNPR